MTERFGRIVADADVLAADLLVGNEAREAIDFVRSHSWLTLVASAPLLDDAEAVIRQLADEPLASDWRQRIETLADLVEHPPEDHPAIASAYHGDAAHLLSFDPGLRSASAGAAVRARVETSIKHPGAFVNLFEPSRAYEEVVGGEYSGPDRDPRG